MLDVTVAATLPDSSPFAGKYELELGTCTGRDDLDVRRETGYSVIGLFQEMQQDRGLGLTFTCVVAWLVRRRQFPDMRFGTVLDSTNWNSDFSLQILSDDEAEAGKVTAATAPD